MTFEKRTLTPIEFWKNFNLGTELSISGSFIYNGIKHLDEMESFYHEEEVFEFLYNISVGIERLQKVLIILSENDSKSSAVDFERSLITHNHMELMKRICEKFPSKMAGVDSEFIQLLSEFYNSWRYDRYTFGNYRNYAKEKEGLVSFLEKYLKISITTNSFFVTPNDSRIKIFLGRRIGKVSSWIYQKICEVSDQRGLYTSELATDSKAFKIFIRNKYDFISENVMWKELLIYIIQNSESDDNLKFLSRQLDCLDFDPADIPDLILSLKSDLLKQKHIDMLDTLYEGVENVKERLDFMKVIDHLPINQIDEE